MKYYILEGHKLVVCKKVFCGVNRSIKDVVKNAQRKK